MNKTTIQLQIFLFAFLFLHAHHTHAKVIEDVESLGRFDKKSWSYLTKFAAASGEGSFEVKAKFYKTMVTTHQYLNLSILAYTEDEWNSAREVQDCKAKTELAKVNLNLAVPTKTQWSESVHGKIAQDRTKVWYFVLADCEKQITPFAIGNRVQWEVKAFNSDGSHFSQDENGMILPLVLVMVVIVGFFLSNSIRFYKFYNTEEGLDYPTLITTIALFFEFMSLMCEILHLWIYAGDGKGSAVFNFFSHVLSISSQFLIACLLLLIAYGWSINFFEFEDMDVFIPLGILLGVVHIIVVGVGKITDDEHYRYHDYENWAGIVIIILRMILFIFWVYLLSDSYRASRGAEREFFAKFGVFGGIYFLAFPFLVVFSSWFVTPSSRHKVVTTGTLFMQTVTLVILTLLFTTKKSQYHLISMKGKTILPSNKFA